MHRNDLASISTSGLTVRSAVFPWPTDRRNATTPKNIAASAVLRIVRFAVAVAVETALVEPTRISPSEPFFETQVPSNARGRLPTTPKCAVSSHHLSQALTGQSTSGTTNWGFVDPLDLCPRYSSSS